MTGKVAEVNLGKIFLPEQIFIFIPICSTMTALHHIAKKKKKKIPITGPKSYTL